MPCSHVTLTISVPSFSAVLLFFNGRAFSVSDFRMGVFFSLNYHYQVWTSQLLFHHGRFSALLFHTSATLAGAIIVCL